MKKSLENRIVRLETLVTEWGKDAEIKKLNERIEDQALSIKTLQQQLMSEQKMRIETEFELKRVTEK